MDQTPLSDLTVDTSNLYREETITDLKAGSVRKLVPIRVDGTDDDQRDVIYTGQTHVMTNAGPVPVQCPLEGKTLEEALASFPAAVEKAIQRLVEEVRELQRQEASRIVVPGTTPGGNIQLK
jgi:hypothetical protein